MRTVVLVIVCCAIESRLTLGAPPDVQRATSTRSLSELIASIRNPASSVDRIQAVEQIACFGRNAVPSLSGLLRDEDTTVGEYALLALLRLGPEAEQAIPAVLGIATNPEDPRRIFAINTLEAIGPSAADAVPALTPLVSSQDSELRPAALAALASIGGAHAELTLAGILQHGDVRHQLELLGMLRDRPRTALRLLPTLVVAYQRGPPTIESAVLAVMSRTPQSAVGPMIRLLRSEELESRRRGARGLSQPALARTAVEAVPWLVDSLTDADSVLRFWSLRALGAIGAPSQGTTAALLTCLTDTDADVRWQALGTIERLGLQEQALGRLTKLRADPHPAVRMAAEHLLASSRHRGR